MNTADASRPQLKIRRVNLDTGRENVVVISRRSTALRPEVFRVLQPRGVASRLQGAAGNASYYR